MSESDTTKLFAGTLVLQREAHPYLFDRLSMADIHRAEPVKSSDVIRDRVVNCGGSFTDAISPEEFFAQDKI